MVTVILSTGPQDAALVDALISDPEVQGDRIVRDRSSGGGELLNVMLVLTPVVLHAVVRILQAKWTRDSKVKIQARGVTLEGVSPAQAEAILKQLLGDSGERRD
jgi:hypothetical protein